MPPRARAIRKDDGTLTWVEYQDIGAPPTPPPPPPPGATIFGYNNADPTRLVKMNRWRRVPCGRGYYGTTALPSTGNGFKSGGKEFKLAGLDVAGIVSSRRVNVSSKFTLGSITSSSSAKVVETKNYALSVPAGWTVYIGWHEYNRKRTAAELLQFISSFQFLGEAVYEANLANEAAGRGEVIYIINAAGSGLDNVTFDDTSAPAASTMPPNTQFWADAYGNPDGHTPPGYKAYGSRYPAVGSVFNDVYDIASALGYLTNTDGGSRGWGIGETGSPRRAAPALSTLDATLGWGPLSPHDISGAGQAQWITDACEYALGNFDPTRPIPAKVFLNWVQPAGSNWNQDYSTAGNVSPQDDGTAANPGPHYQGFPINVPPDLPYNAYKHYVDISA